MERITAVIDFFHQWQAGGWPVDDATLRLLLPALGHTLTEAELAGLLAQLQAGGFDLGDFDALLVDLNTARLVSRLTELFTRLRFAATAPGLEQYTPLGIADYMLLLRALRQNVLDWQVAEPLPILRRLCRLIWVKTQADEPLFDHYFEAVMVGWPLALPPPAPSPAPETEVKPVATERPAPTPEPTPPPGAARKQPAPTPEPRFTPPPLKSPGHGRDLLQFDILAATTQVAYERYLLATDYLPLTRRQMKQNWRFLRRMGRDGPRIEIDVRATLNQISRDGFFLEPVLRPRRVNKAALILLLDQQGSMVPFHILGHHLAETITTSGRLGQTGVYYFHNFPGVAPAGGRFHPDPQYRDHLLFQKPGTDARLASLILADFDPEQTSVLIFSDAGAARGGWNETRIHNTAFFVYQLQAHGIEHIAWLNPMPRARWLESTNNSARAIHQFVPMFSIDQRGIREAVDVLRGRSAQRVRFG